jgi:hypothetical protein
METMTTYTHGGAEAPREIVKRMIDILQGALDVGRLDSAEVRRALCAMVREELADLEGKDGPDNDGEGGK